MSGLSTTLSASPAEAAGLLREHTSALVRGEFRLLLISGGAGAGKSHALREVLGDPALAGVTKLVAASPPWEWVPPFWPWIQIYSRLKGVGETRDVQAEALFNMLDEVGGKKPLIFVLEDIERFDPGSLNVLREVVVRAPRACLIFASYRPGDLGRKNALRGVLDSLGTLANVNRVALRGFGEAEAAAFVSRLIRAKVPAEFPAVHRVTGGNPFLLEQVAHLWRRGEWLGKRRLVVPTSAREIVDRRVEVLSQQCRAVLRAAVVLGLEMSAIELDRMLRVIPGPGVISAFEEAMIERFVERASDDGPRYCITHRSLREHVYAAIPLTERALFHRAAAEVLRQIYPHPGPHIWRLVHHVLNSADGESAGQAVDLCMAAAREARHLGAREQEMRCYESALDVLDLESGGGVARRAELLAALERVRG